MIDWSPPRVRFPPPNLPKNIGQVAIHSFASADPQISGRHYLTGNSLREEHPFALKSKSDMSQRNEKYTVNVEPSCNPQNERGQPCSIENTRARSALSCEQPFFCKANRKECREGVPLVDRRLQSYIPVSTKRVVRDEIGGIGSRLVRSWRGTRHEVMVVEKGFVHRGKVYRSLSEIARVITGARWSGPRFFGLKVSK